jgi:hypothetical protein
VFEASAAAIARVNNVLDAVMVPPVGNFARTNWCPSHFTDSFVRYPSLDSRLEMLFGGVKVSPQIVARHLSSTTSGILYEKDDCFIPQIARWLNAVSMISRQMRRTSSLERAQHEIKTPGLSTLSSHDSNYGFILTALEVRVVAKCQSRFWSTFRC